MDIRLPGCLYTDGPVALKPVGLVQRSAATWRRAAFIAWTEWTLAMALSWWQNYKYHSGYYYYYY